MITRYKTDERGKSVPVAEIYTSGEHGIHNSQIDKDALWAIRRIQQSGAEAYIVGGAIRDIMLGRTPKDFDIATSASPKQIMRLFWNSRAVGRRFKIVHVFFGNKIIEVTTFRSDEENFVEGNNNIFGTMEQDSKRRDFSINSLYYNPSNGHLVDFNHSMADFKKKEIRSLIPLKYTFSEDPVRMIRALKYQATTGFSLRFDVKVALMMNHKNIQDVSNSRLTDEFVKIIFSGSSKPILLAMHKYGIMQYVAPALSQYMKYDAFRNALSEVDEEATAAKAEGKGPDGSRLIYRMMKPLAVISNDALTYDELRHDVFRQIKVLLAPLTPPNYELEKAAELVLEDYGHKAVRKKGVKKKAPEPRKMPQKKKAKAKPVKEQKKGSPQVDANVTSSAEAHDL